MQIELSVGETNVLVAALQAYVAANPTDWNSVMGCASTFSKIVMAAQTDPAARAAMIQQASPPRPENNSDT